ncbi:accessory Sec system S-layer assembly protein [Alteribacillus bidgolensis]|uniref:Accessory Sec system S-layer assembly protein n=1 Tax=Alteribacillus bidgolensis TaxID=930129 RepID=A0A1G8DY10_9BACI|nr:accessory Sec system S-layer assembly protein [Alteribacillus bidgolensis]SDH62602.1 accessory Sec system S-layer assembly protein [Alteribacillus bidgolensis]
MLSFFRKKGNGKPKMEGNETTVSSEELLNETSETDDTEQKVETDLSIHPEWTISKEDQYSFQFLNMECPPLKPNQISLSGISLQEEKDGQYQVTAFIRNSLNKTIKLHETTLVLLDSTDKVLGRKTMDLSQAGEIPGKSSRPWKFSFAGTDLFITELPNEGWKLAFQLKPSSRKHSLSLENSWEQSLAEKDKVKLQEMVDNLTPPKPGEVNFMGLKALRKENGDLHVTMLIRNGSNKNINLEQIPLQVEDASGETIAKGGFTLDKFEVKANTSKPWTFIFPQELVSDEEIDLSSWQAYPVQKNKNH